MNVNTSKLILLLSVLLNIILGSVLIIKSCSNSQSTTEGKVNNKDLATLQKKASEYLHTAICENLYYPNTYDPVKTTIDSVFYSPLTDGECVQAAEELIDLRSQYSSAQHAYNEAVDQIKFFWKN